MEQVELTSGSILKNRMSIKEQVMYLLDTSAEISVETHISLIEEFVQRHYFQSIKLLTKEDFVNLAKLETYKLYLITVRELITYTVAN